MTLTAKEKDKEFLPTFVDFDSLQNKFEIWTSDLSKVGDYVIELSAKFTDYPDWPELTYDINLTVMSSGFGFDFSVEEPLASEESTEDEI